MAISVVQHLCCFFFFFNDTATTEIYTLSLHDALPIWNRAIVGPSQIVSEYTADRFLKRWAAISSMHEWKERVTRSEEHTSELQSQSNLVCRLLLEKKKTTLLL